MRKFYVSRGEHTCKRVGDVQNFNTRGSIIRVDEDEKSYFYLVSYMGLLGGIEPVDMSEATEISWLDVDVALRQRHFKELHPDANEEEYNIGVYGEEEGNRMNEENKWADEHLVFSRELTLRLKDELGEFSKVVHLNFKSTPNFVMHKYSIDGKWLITITFDDKIQDVIGAYKIQPLTQARQDKFYKRLGILVKEANVPWTVAYTVGHFDDKEVAIEFIEKIKDARKNATEKIKNDFFTGKIDATIVIDAILDKPLMNQLNLSDGKCKNGLANFLLSC